MKLPACSVRTGGEFVCGDDRDFVGVRGSRSQRRKSWCVWEAISLGVVALSCCAAAAGNSFSLSGVCDDRGQHAADTAAAREPGIERLM